MPKTVRPENQEPYRIVVTKHLKPALGAIRVQRLSVQAIETFYGDTRQRPGIARR